MEDTWAETRLVNQISDFSFYKLLHYSQACVSKQVMISALCKSEGQ